MTRDDIIRLAIKCQLVTTSNRDGIYADALQRFAALVAVEKNEKIFALREEIAALREERRRDMFEICSLRESEESLREEVKRLREALKRHGMHNADCFLRGECNCGLDAALQGETAIWSARRDPRE